MKTDKELQFLLNQCPSHNSVYRHYKGELYQVLFSVIQESTLEPYVVYEAFGSTIPFARPLREWVEKVIHEGIEMERYTLEDR